MRAVAVVGMVLLCGIAQGAEPKTVTTTIGMELIEMPAGTFMMGFLASERSQSSFFKKQFAVRLTKPFWLGKTEVTQGQFKKVMGTEPWVDHDLSDRVLKIGFVQIGQDNAATYVSWDDAREFCGKLTGLERKAGKLKAGEAYRLPTEAEWEYACRAGKKTKYSFGNDEKQLGEYAWFRGNTRDAGEQYAHAVGLKKPNPWGLHDMHGNVWEWCSDWVGDDGIRAVLPGGTDPDGPWLPRGVQLNENDPESPRMHRVLRGGSWWDDPNACRSAYRHSYGPPFRSDYLGFRVARSQSAQ